LPATDLNTLSLALTVVFSNTDMILASFLVLDPVTGSDGDIKTGFITVLVPPVLVLLALRCPPGLIPFSFVRTVLNFTTSSIFNFPPVNIPL